MPIFEFHCKKCKKTVEKVFIGKEQSEYIICECGYVANKILSAPGTFDIRGYSYSNGYSKGEK